MGGVTCGCSSAVPPPPPWTQGETNRRRKQTTCLLSEGIRNSIDGIGVLPASEGEDDGRDNIENNTQSKSEESNTKYINGLLDTLESLLDKYIVSGSMATRRRAYNILQQIFRLSMDSELIRKAERMVKRSGMPMVMPPPLPPTEHIPAVDQQLEDDDLHTQKVVKLMGAMSAPPSSLSSTVPVEEEKQREVDVDKRLAWERKHKEKSEFMNKMKDNAPTTNLRSNPDITNNGLDKLSSFADDKKILHNIMNGSTSSSTVASSPEDASPPVITERDKNQSNIMNDYNSVMSAKSSEFIARAGSGDAFLGSVLGVGGLDDVLSRIRRRVWIPLAAPPSLLSQLGIRPVRGLLLYGDPGCGKTLLARKLGDILSPCRPITIVSGPEIMDKFVGSSEKNLRDLFDNPPEIYHEYKKNYGEALSKQALHVIVLDGKTTFLDWMDRISHFCLTIPHTLY